MEKEIKAVNDAQEELEDLDGSNELENDEDFEIIPDDEDGGTEDIEVKEEKKEKKEEKPKQSAEENAKYAAARREAEKIAKESEKKYLDLKNKFNSILSSEIDDKRRDELIKIAEEKGIDPEDFIEREENRLFRAKVKAKEALAEAEKEHEKNAKEKAKADFAEFGKAYPNIDLDKLLKNPSFEKFSKHKLGNQPLVEIYADYEEIVGTVKNTSYKNAISKEERSTGSSEGTSKVQLTSSQAKRLKEWNERNPDFKMSAKEFLEYGG